MKKTGDDRRYELYHVTNPVPRNGELSVREEDEIENLYNAKQIEKLARKLKAEKKRQNNSEYDGT